MLSALLPVFAIEQSVTEITDSSSITDNSFVIKGYYKGALDTKLNFVINDLSGNVLYQSYADATDAEHVNHTSNIFTWTMSGQTKKNKYVTVRFTFDTLQAEIEGKFYRPRYALNMYLNQTKDPNGNYLSDKFYDNNSGKKFVKITGDSTYTATKPNNPSDSRYTQTGSVEYTGRIANSGTSSVSWVRSGYCTLNISDYEDTTPGSYNYTCTVIVEISLTL